jgi:uncharacterized protein (TIGR02594 family)
MMASRSVRAQGGLDQDYNDYSGALPNLALFGSNPALPSEEQEAKVILSKAPSASTIVDTALYFVSLPQINEKGEFYNAAWASQWNPVIVAFYHHTNLASHYVLVMGDTIPWCAAFLNWCLEANGFATTNSAGSGSFRTYGNSVQTPSIGDIVVFKSGDVDEARVGRGHVGIFVDKTAEGLWILGGNQKAGKHYSSVCISYFPSTMKKLVLHSFRRPVHSPTPT